MTSLLLRKAPTTGRVVSAASFIRRRYLSTPTSAPPLEEADPLLVDARFAPNGFASSSAVVYRNFISVGEADGLVQDLQESPLKRYVRSSPHTVHDEVQKTSMPLAAQY